MRKLCTDIERQNIGFRIREREVPYHFSHIIALGATAGRRYVQNYAQRTPQQEYCGGNRILVTLDGL
jgi:hypothetical protein